jgi:hypothetical protein
MRHSSSLIPKKNNDKQIKSGSEMRIENKQKHGLVGGHEEKREQRVTINGVNNGDISFGETSKHREEIEKEHQEELEKVGKVPSVKVEQTLLRGYVNQTLWKKKKFIAAGKELDYKTTLCLKIISDLNVGSTDRKSFWLRNRKHISTYLGIKRNNVVTSLKQNFFSKFSSSMIYMVTNIPHVFG